MGLILGFRSIPSPGIVLISGVKYIYDPETLTTMALHSMLRARHSLMI
jgi:hypothetical protein